MPDVLIDRVGASAIHADGRADIRADSRTAVDPSPDVARRSATIDDVRRAIPASCYARSTPRGLALALQDTVLWMGALVGVALIRSPLLSLPFAVLAGFAVSAMFVTAHDAAHGSLVPGRRLNRAIALVLMLPSLHVREAWEFGHNRVHHGFTVREGIDFVWHPLTTEQYRSLGRLARLRHRLEWSFFGSGAYYVREVWWRKMMRFDPPARHARGITRDRRIVVAFAVVSVGASAWLGWVQSHTVIAAVWAPIELVVLPFLVFSQVIGWTVHVHHVQPDTRWYSAKEWTKYRAQMEGTTILRISPFFDVFFHRIFVHVPHHVDMRIPCYHLEAAADAINAAFPGVVVDRKLRMRDYLRATRECKLYDFENGHWCRYPDAVSA